MTLSWCNCQVRQDLFFINTFQDAYTYYLAYQINQLISHAGMNLTGFLFSRSKIWRLIRIRRLYPFTQRCFVSRLIKSDEMDLKKLSMHNYAYPDNIIFSWKRAMSFIWTHSNWCYLKIYLLPILVEIGSEVERFKCSRSLDLSAQVSSKTLHLDC